MVRMCAVVTVPAATTTWDSSIRYSVDFSCGRRFGFVRIS